MPGGNSNACRYRYDVKQTQEELVFSHLREYELEVTIVRCAHLSVPKEIATVDSYVYITFPYPKAESPQILRSGSVSQSLDPGTIHSALCSLLCSALKRLLVLAVYNFVGKLQVERAKSFLRFCERKRPMSVDIYHHRLFGRDVLLGKGVILLNELINKCEVTQTIELQKPNSRKGSAEASSCVAHPHLSFTYRAPFGSASRAAGNMSTPQNAPRWQRYPHS